MLLPCLQEITVSHAKINGKIREKFKLLELLKNRAESGFSLFSVHFESCYIADECKEWIDALSSWTGEGPGVDQIGTRDAWLRNKREKGEISEMESIYTMY